MFTRYVIQKQSAHTTNFLVGFATLVKFVGEDLLTLTLASETLPKETSDTGAVVTLAFDTIVKDIVVDVIAMDDYYEVTMPVDTVDAILEDAETADSLTIRTLSGSGFQDGVCVLTNCNEPVFIACPQCQSFLCYDHIHTSCSEYNLFDLVVNPETRIFQRYG